MMYVRSFVVALLAAIAAGEWCTSYEVHQMAFSDSECKHPLRYYESPWGGCGKHWDSSSSSEEEEEELEEAFGELPGASEAIIVSMPEENKEKEDAVDKDGEVMKSGNWHHGRKGRKGKGRGRHGPKLMNDRCYSVFLLGESHCTRKLEERCEMVAEGVYQKTDCQRFPKDRVERFFLMMVAKVFLFFMVCVLPVCCRRQNAIARELGQPGACRAWKQTYCCCLPKCKCSCKRRKGAKVEPSNMEEGTVAEMAETTPQGETYVKL